jgi:hypothetical protein
MKTDMSPAVREAGDDLMQAVNVTKERTQFPFESSEQAAQDVSFSTSAPPWASLSA